MNYSVGLRPKVILTKESCNVLPMLWYVVNHSVQFRNPKLT